MAILSLFFVFLGAIYFIYAIFYYVRILKETKELSMRFWWISLFVLTLFFLLGYVGVGYSMVVGSTFFQSQLFISSIFLFGSIFVLVSAYLFYIVVNALRRAQGRLKKQNKNLEGLVKQRTKKLEVLYKKTLDHEKKIQKLKDEFVFIAAHELRSPVNAIRWNLDVFKDIEAVKKLSKSDRDILEDVGASNMRLIELVDDLLNVARIEYGSFSVKLENVVVKDIVQSAVKEIKILTKEKGISIEDQTEDSLPLVLADNIRAKEVVINLLSNAIKYNKEKGKIVIGAKLDKKNVVISVGDTGIGMTKGEHSKLFTKFYRAENETVRNIGGTGLGLYITKRMVEKMGGKIWAESEGIGKGTVFFFTLSISKKK